MILGDLSACVFIDGEALPEYDVTDSSTPTENRIICWIASAAGKKFGVRGEILAQQSSGIRSTVSVDGVRCPAWVIPPGWSGTMERTYLSNEYVRRDFIFSNIELTDDDSMLGDQNSKDIGQIVFEVKRGEYHVKEKVDNVNIHALRVREGKVHERSKKAFSHCVGFGEETPCRDLWTSDYIIVDNSPATVFIFKYTRLDILQAMGIAPPVPKTSIETEDYDDEVEVNDGLNEPSPSEDVKPQIQQLEMELQRLRAQLTSSEDRKPSCVKLKRGVSRRQRAAIEVIDLTED
ncbi:hypothetical protein DFH29DRAFT_893034 [Suillus ampliporus]|nr:hypothetical protein DFH29DRAFT_893034 [Suillus ampliporus]